MKPCNIHCRFWETCYVNQSDDIPCTHPSSGFLVSFSQRFCYFCVNKHSLGLWGCIMISRNMTLALLMYHAINIHISNYTLHWYISPVLVQYQLSTTYISHSFACRKSFLEEPQYAYIGNSPFHTNVHVHTCTRVSQQLPTTIHYWMATQPKRNGSLILFLVQQVGIGKCYMQPGYELSSFVHVCVFPQRRAVSNILRSLNKSTNLRMMKFLNAWEATWSTKPQLPIRLSSLYQTTIHQHPTV